VAQPDLSYARAVLAEAEARVAARPASVQTIPGNSALIPVDPALAELFPHGGLRRGSAIAVKGSTSLALALLAEASRSGSWVVAVGMPTFGLLAAHQWGINFTHTAVIPQPGTDTPAIVAALIDGVDVVLLGEKVALADSDRRRLLARARERGSVLISLQPWPGADVVFTVTQVGWEGIGQGEGCLRGQRIQVVRTGRSAASVPTTVDLYLDERTVHLRKSPQPSLALVS
jgi:hypothetical protein